MPSKTTFGIAAAMLAGMLSAPAPSALARDRLIARGVAVDADTGEAAPMAAFGGALAWYGVGNVDDEGDVIDHPLMVRLNGVTRSTGVRSGSTTSIDLGPGRRGGPVAIYSRCPGGGCDLFELALRARRERRLAALSSRSGAEVAGATWRGRYLVTRRARFGGLFAGDPLRRIDRASPEQLDLRGHVAAFQAFVGPTRNTEVPSRDSAIVIRRVTGGRPCIVARARPPELGPDDLTEVRDGRGFVWSPSLDGGYVHWLQERTRRRRTATTIRRKRLPSAGCRAVGRTQTGRVLAADYAAVDRGRVFYTSAPGLFEATDPRPRFR